jgi:hypothetical protein
MSTVNIPSGIPADALLAGARLAGDAWHCQLHVGPVEAIRRDRRGTTYEQAAQAVWVTADGLVVCELFRWDVVADGEPLELDGVAWSQVALERYRYDQVVAVSHGPGGRPTLTLIVDGGPRIGREVEVVLSETVDETWLIGKIANYPPPPAIATAA